jgi:hypothetical protein
MFYSNSSPDAEIRILQGMSRKTTVVLLLKPENDSFYDFRCKFRPIGSRF